MNNSHATPTITNWFVFPKRISTQIGGLFTHKVRLEILFYLVDNIEAKVIFNFNFVDQ